MDRKQDADGDVGTSHLLHPMSKGITTGEYSTTAHTKFLEKLLDINGLIDTSEKLFKQPISDISSSSEDEQEQTEAQSISKKSSKKPNGTLKKSYRSQFTEEEWKEEKLKFYNLKSIGSERSWLQDILISDNSDGSDDSELGDEDLKQMLKIHLQQKEVSKEFAKNSELIQDEYSLYSSSLILEHDKYHDRVKKKKRSQKVILKSKKPLSIINTNNNNSNKNKKTLKKKDNKKLKMLEAKRQRQQQLQHEKDIQYKRRKIWNFINKKDIPKVCRSKTNGRGTMLATLKKVSQACQREKRREAARSQKIAKEAIPRARRMAKEMLLYWKKFDKVEKEHRKKAEKEAMEQRRQDEEMREMKRQQRKLNFLITQTELYAHFMSRKKKGGQDIAGQTEILKKLDDPSDLLQHCVKGGVLVNNNADEYDSEAMKTKALVVAQNAVLAQEKKLHAYEGNSEKKSVSQNSFDTTFSLANPSLNSEKNLPQPKIFDGKLKTYQLKGMNWLINLYEQGINGILADEMGLGKTVQSISFLAYLAEAHDIWGPFLVVAPASTLHNWQQEFTKFLPRFKVLPYWGDPNDRKSLRKFWNQTSSYLTDSEKAPFHVLITSYQLIVQDVKYFQRIRWQYLILDEAHAIKSSSSLRWKILLGYNCRNRLLLTGTPIQNTMAELWALLHFIMPTLFDSHDEFNEWFSKDIENHASERKPNLDQNQLSRLHMILKPFMLRRVKKDVENELSEKIEIKVICEMSSRQKKFYQAVKNKILFEDLLQSTTTNSEKATSLLMNLVMQFRKVCNHPELFERKEPSTGLFFKLPALEISKMFYRNALLGELPYHQTSLFEKSLLIWNPYHIHHSLENGSSTFGFSRFINLTAKECAMLFRCLVTRLIYCILSKKLLQRLDSERKYRKKKPISNNSKEKRSSLHLSRKDLLICKPVIGPLTSDDRLEDLVFTSYTSPRVGFTSCKIRCKETNITIIEEEPIIRECIVHYYPSFLTSYSPKVYSPPIEVYCSDRSAVYQYQRRMYGSPELLRTLESGLDTLSKEQRNLLFFPPPMQGMEAVRPLDGWSKVKVPDRSTLLSDSGKLTVLDTLLTRMKVEGHRVLIYSQMTKMIDILEEFMNFRQHSYIRLDGSSKISDRRDMVNDFQNRDDIFAFLLSTRAGGLGINLTAADTVIFYDSDWNPTVDQQAMDRAHRLGQKRQVTVYRLVTKGTVEEKILNRAREKSEIQNIVISGGQFNKDVLRPKEVVSLLLDDIELEKKLKQRQVEKKFAEESGRRPGRKRKTPVENSVPTKQTKTNETSEESMMNENNLSRQSSVDADENSMSSIDLGGMNSFDEQPTENGSSILHHSPSSSPGPSGRGRGRGRARGRGKTKSGSLAKAAASAAAAAGAAAGSAAAYAAYGYSFHASSASKS